MVARLVPETRAGRLALAAILVGWLVAGVLVGRAHAWNQSVGGMTAAFGGIVFVLAAAALLVFGLVAAVVERSGRAARGAGRRALLAGFAGVLAGGVLGYATAAATGGTYREPLVRESTGTTDAEVSSPTATFTPRADGPAACAAVPDGVRLDSITATDLGALAGKTLRASIWRESASSIRLELYIDAGDLGDGTQPTWSGLGTITAGSFDGLAATVSFDELAAVTDPKLPAPEPAWAGALSGTLSWTCEPFE